MRFYANSQCGHCGLLRLTLLYRDSGPETSEERVAVRVSKGGHDVPSEKLVSQFPRTLANLKAAAQALPAVLVFDNDDHLDTPFRRLAEFQSGKAVFVAERVPQRLRALL